MLPILMYHNVAHPPEGAAMPGLYVPPGTFARHMNLLRLFRYRGISMAEAGPYLRRETSGRVVVLTFDDGYADTVTNALPILQDVGFTATCFVVSGRLGGYNDWDAERLRVRKPLMTADQLATWAAAGMEVGAHTRSHVRLTQCDDAALQAEIQGSREDLEEAVGGPVRNFCYPYGDYDARVLNAVRAAGFHTAVTTRRGRAGRDADPHQLPRVLVRGDDREGRLLLKLLTRYEERRSRRQHDVPPLLSNQPA
jgi:peptidoglycan/xylan/chitin deacetylase (PgdA/CDA1 family)